MLPIPESYTIFNTSFYDELHSSLIERRATHTKKMLKSGNQRKINLTNEQVYEIYKIDFNSNASETAKFFDVSEAAIRKRIKKVCLGGAVVDATAYGRRS